MLLWGSCLYKGLSLMARPVREPSLGDGRGEADGLKDRQTPYLERKHGLGDSPPLPPSLCKQCKDWKCPSIKGQTRSPQMGGLPQRASRVH